MLYLTTQINPGLIPSPCKMNVLEISKEDLQRFFSKKQIDQFIYGAINNITIPFPSSLSHFDSFVVPFFEEASKSGLPVPSDGKTYFVLTFRLFELTPGEDSLRSCPNFRES